MQFLDCKITLSFSNQKIKDRSETLINKGMYEVKFKFIVSLIFFEHKKLNTIAISNTIKEIGISAFFDCNSLTSVTISNSVTSIGNRAFSRCKSLTSITLGDKVTTLGDWAFFDCIGLTSITIPNSVTSIGNEAFSGCRALTSITIPSSVTSIGDYVFNDCSGLTSINVESGNREYDSRDNCNAIIETSSNTLIVGCKNTIIPNSVTSIGNDVFSVCHKLETVKSEIEKPFEINAFDAISFSESTLIVPKGTKSLYQATSGWKEFVNITEEN